MSGSASSIALLRAWTLRVLSFALVALSLGFLAYRVAQDWERLDPGDLSLAAGPLLAHLGLLGLSFLLLIGGWRLLLGSSGSAPSFRMAARSWLLGSVARYIPGKVASVAGRVVVHVRDGGRGTTAAAALVIEQALYALIGLVFLAAAAYRLAPGSVASIEAWGVLIGAVAAMVIALQPAVIRYIGRIASRLTGRGPVTLELGYGRLATVGLLLVAGWSLHGLAGYALVRTVAPLGPEYLAEVVLAFVGSWAAGFLAFLVPAGLGVREAALALFLSSLLPGPLGVVVALLGRLTWMVVEVLGIALVTLPGGGGGAPGGPLAETRGDEDDR